MLSGCKISVNYYFFTGGAVMALPENLSLEIRRMIVERLFLPEAPEDIKEEANLFDEYGVDSVSLLEMIVGLEEEFGIAVDPDGFDPSRFQTVTDICSYVRENTQH